MDIGPFDKKLPVSWSSQSITTLLNSLAQNGECATAQSDYGREHATRENYSVGDKYLVDQKSYSSSYLNICENCKCGHIRYQACECSDLKSFTKSQTGMNSSENVSSPSSASTEIVNRAPAGTDQS